MGVREVLRNKVTAMVVVPLAVIAVAVTIWISWSSGSSYVSVGKSFYTDDDGVSYFSDSSDKIMPFAHNGREAVGAVVYVGSDGKPFVAYVIRHTAMARQQFAAAQAKGQRPGTVNVSPTLEAKPARSRAAWVPDTSPQFRAITSPPTSGTEPLKPLSP